LTGGARKDWGEAPFVAGKGIRLSPSQEGETAAATAPDVTAQTPSRAERAIVATGLYSDSPL
jgi:hypothetical protein